MTTGDVVNLRRYRKCREREDEARRAEENRRLHGRNKSEKQEARLTKDRQDRHLDGHRLDE